MTTTLRNRFPTLASLPASVALIHDHQAERIVAIRLDCGAIMRVCNPDPHYRIPASESAVEYRLGAQADRALSEAVDDETERLQDLAKDEGRDHANALHALGDQNQMLAARLCEALYALEQVRDCAIRNPVEALRLANSAITADTKHTK
jgi:hypothetical protein